MDTRVIKVSGEGQGNRKPPYIHRAECATKKAKHDCKPRGGPKGTHNRWSCKVCGKRFSPSPAVHP